MKTAGIILLFCGVSAALSGAETSEQRGKRVIDDCVAALGGSKFLSMEDRVETGRAYSFYREELSGLSKARIYTRYLKRPEGAGLNWIGVRERQAFGKDESSYVLFTDGNGYEVTFRGARPLPDEILARYLDTTRHNIFYILRERLNEPGLTFESRGADIYENLPIEIVDITDADNRTVTVYFSQNTKLPLRQVFQRRNPVTKDRDEEVTIFSKYRDNGGITWPMAVRRERNGEKIFELFADTVEFNRNLKDNLFTLPGNIKILKKPRASASIPVPCPPSPRAGGALTPPQAVRC